MIKKYTEQEILELREKIIIEAKKMINVPYAHRGRTRFGIDCLGLPWLSYKKAGIEGISDGDGRGYGVNWHWTADRERYLDGVLQYFNITENPVKADIILFKTVSNFYTHGGIYLGNTSFIHALSGKKVRLDDLKCHRYWNKCSNKYLVFKGFV